MVRRLIVLLVSAIVAAVPLAAAEPEAAEAAAVERPAAWAKPLDEPGLPNLHRVDAGLYRGAQPSAEGMRRLEAMGIKTVVSLRAFNDDDDELAGTALAKVRISFKTWHPEGEDVAAFLVVVRDPAKQPVFVHCLHGADRTGMMCAIYRVVQQGWTRDDAIREMTTGGYGFHAMWKDVVTYVREFDATSVAP
jgi:protein tyrosine/serine phosphatase